MQEAEELPWQERKFKFMDSGALLCEQMTSTYFSFTVSYVRSSISLGSCFESWVINNGSILSFNCGIV